MCDTWVILLILCSHVYFFFPRKKKLVDQTRGSNNRRKGNRGQDIEEEPNVNEEYASALDMSCLTDGLVRAPQIPNGEVIRYVR